MSASKSTKAEVIKETLTFIRAHSTIRFVALPFLLAAMGVLAKAFFEIKKPTITDPILEIAVAGLGLSVIALVLEIVLSRNLIAWWTALKPLLATSPPWTIVASHRNSGALVAARWALVLPYVAAFGFWTYQVLALVFDAPQGIKPERHLMVLKLLAGMACLAVCAAAQTVWSRARCQTHGLP